VSGVISTNVVRLLEVSKELKHEAGIRRAERALEETAAKGARRRRRSP